MNLKASTFILFCQLLFAILVVPDSQAFAKTLDGVGTVTGVSFFRSPDSLFESGQAHPKELEKRKIGGESTFVYKIRKENRKLHIPAEALIRDIDLSVRVAHSKTGLTAHWVGKKGAYAFVVDEKGRRDWWALSELLPVPDDLGLAVNLLPIMLRKDSAWKSEVVFDVKGLTRLRIHRFKENWAEVSDFSNPKILGWIESSSLYLKADLASFVLINGKKWEPVKYRQGSHVVLGNSTRVHLSEITGYMTRPDLGIVTTSLVDLGLSPRSMVVIESLEFANWVISRLPGHGDVYWKRGSQVHVSTASAQDSTTTYLEILKRPIFSVSFHHKNPRVGIISAEGIFFTQDGINWRKLPQFSNENLPVAISSEFEIFVGDQRSTDQAKNFRPYIKWDQVSRIVDGKSNLSSKILRLAKIETKPGQKISLDIDNGRRLWKLTGSTKFGLVSQWAAEDKASSIAE